MFHSLTRVGDLRRRNYQLLAREEILGLKPSSLREPRPDGKQQPGQKRDHRPLHYHTPTRSSSPGQGFREAQGNGELL